MVEQSWLETMLARVNQAYAIFDALDTDFGQMHLVLDYNRWFIASASAPQAKCVELAGFTKGPFAIVWKRLNRPLSSCSSEICCVSLWIYVLSCILHILLSMMPSLRFCGDGLNNDELVHNQLLIWIKKHCYHVKIIISYLIWKQQFST